MTKPSLLNLVKAIGLAAVLVVPGLAQAVGIGVRFGLVNQTEVTPLENGVIQVKAAGSSAPVAYWCGVGDYAMRTLRTKATQRIYVSRAYERGARTVLFTLTPPPGADTDPGYSVTVKRVGENMSAASAQRYCYDNTLDFGF
ncbi:hypothetical protein [Ruegeria sp.]|uniref:hypothetical protein n=1 Tax=Ruegeria sp. TaxID=1879320 RepID=UPI0023174E37|nr:hypothetical protein [Ruegeria sp.]MDA7967076.1 hypothetical protein [Ruegeria sp.]